MIEYKSKMNNHELRDYVGQELGSLTPTWIQDRSCPVAHLEFAQLEKAIIESNASKLTKMRCSFRINTAKVSSWFDRKFLGIGFDIKP